VARSVVSRAPSLSRGPGSPVRGEPTRRRAPRPDNVRPADRGRAVGHGRPGYDGHVTDRSPEPVALHVSLRGLAAVFVSPLLLLGLGLASLLSVGQHPVPLAFVVTGGAILVYVVLGFPHRIVLDRDGFQRECLLRRHFVPWHQVASIDRTRPTTAAAIRSLSASPADSEPIVSGGLMASGRGRRQWMLTDSVESQDEYDRLRDLLDSVETHVALRARRPHSGVAPTDLYRPRRR
jgi:hypothetical protein